MTLRTPARTVKPRPFAQGVLANDPAPAPKPSVRGGVRLDPHEEAALYCDCPPDDDDGPELPDVGPDGYPESYDDYDRWQARMSLWLAGHAHARSDPMPKPLKIDQIYAYLSVDPDDGVEGIIGVMSAGGWFPLVGADMAMAEKLKPFARAIAEDSGKTVRLARFTVREDLETFQP